MIGKVELRLTPGRGEVIIDGHDIALGVTSLSLDAQAHDLPRLSVMLDVAEIEVDGRMRVIVPTGTREALITLGWTPPADDADA